MVREEPWTANGVNAGGEVNVSYDAGAIDAPAPNMFNASDLASKLDQMTMAEILARQSREAPLNEGVQEGTGLLGRTLATSHFCDA